MVTPCADWKVLAILVGLVDELLEYYFWYWYHILHCKDSVFISKHGITNEKTAFKKSRNSKT